MTTLIASLIISTFAFASNTKVMTVEGAFEKVESGDYIHLILKVPKDERVSLVCSDLPKSLVKGIDCNELAKNQDSYKGKVLKVAYHEESKLIPEAGEKIVWKYVDRIDLKK
ncbi:hypothetical protein DOM22_11095 [Bdellovibrio sp. ZAP7]|uniref:hypothetical protein n=1 Tax=Bdellovibrio sp. ZAP7 TaxID=2231053 RepID=UPI001158FFE4|nr:hypothetical protein [Bdellovibrio sp. ZAP7]QDK45654.1 hypothetical protein DOM22_11095 [Bdellovibrio sp. ZAP7]